MGGNIFQDNIRLSKEHFEDYSKNVLSKIQKQFPSAKVIPYYEDKESFGDLDILISGQKGNNIFDFLQNEFNISLDKISNNGSNISFQYNLFQVDLIFVPEEDFNTSYNYFSYNDCSNLIGRISHKLGFKYGHKGLSFIIREGNYQFDEIIVSKDTKKILEFLDFDYNVFSNGFKTKDDIFKYVASSKYFNSQIFLLDNRSHSSRIRDRKRVIYSEFLKWVSNNPNLNNYPWIKITERGGYQKNQEFLELAFNVFPGFKEKYEQIEKEFQNQLLIKSKFNGDIVRSITGLEDKKLGAFIQILKSKCDFKTFILNSSENEIKDFILNSFINYSKK